MMEQYHFIHDENIAKIRKEFFGKVKRFLINNYKPQTIGGNGTELLTTKQIFDAAQAAHPSAQYKQADVSAWLKEIGIPPIHTNATTIKWEVKNQTNKRR